ncbi:hypothetical protein [Bifidobacterium simiiventris]|uniref:hypothetical protein n=1 Tax=Bifidobacterium simiiventris TaxID=2834434 RepID=UPI001C55BECD|nr:hypothetical protein [Bifidobacterium simiiventris]MBW3078228.1 hypothetical protein [Bifidobacterium simiiventris]
MNRMTDVTITDHDIVEWREDDTVITWCGKRLNFTQTQTNVTHAEHSTTATVTHISCPLCQAAQIVNQTGITLPDEPKDHGARRLHRGSTSSPGQLMFEGAESW